MALKLVSRSQWGARAYRIPNGATPYSRARRGVKLHYLGTAYSDRAHEKCDDYVRQIQAQHMDGNGWSDIGYSFVVCTHGYVYEGRGLRRRNSANGSTSLNEQDYAVLLMVGSSGFTKPTDVQLDGARDAIEYCRKEGPAGTWLGGHRDGYATACPGDTIYAWVKAGAPRPKTTPTQEANVSLSDDDARKVWQVDGAVAAARPPVNNSDYYKADGKTLNNTSWSAKYALQTAVEDIRKTQRTLSGVAEDVDKLTAAVDNLTTLVNRLIAANVKD